MYVYLPLSEESVLHVLRNCSALRSVWKSIDTTLIKGEFFNSQLHIWSEANLSNRSPFNQGAAWSLRFASTCIVLWYHRNLFIFKGKSIDLLEVVSKCPWLARDYHTAQQVFPVAKRKILG